MDRQQTKMYEDFSSEFDFCWACGIYRSIYREWFPWWKLENAHILRGTGQRKQKGKTDRRNINRLCTLCHKAEDGERIKHPDGFYIPKIELPHMLWMKERHDPEHYDRVFLNVIGIQRMPEPEQPHQFFLNEFKRWQPNFVK